MKVTLPPIVCVGCGRRQDWQGDFGMVGPYVHCNTVNCRHTALSMVEEDQLFGLDNSDDEPVIIPVPAHLDRGA